MTYLATDIINGVKVRATMPTASSLMTEDRILQIANTLIRESVQAEVVNIRQEYLLTKLDMTTVSGQSAYKIPYRAIGRTLRDLKIKTSDGADGINKRDMSLITIDDSHLYSTQSTPTSFYFQGDKAVSAGCGDAYRKT